jgi:hypothetical protein
MQGAVVDLINTDDLAGLKKSLLNEVPWPPARANVQPLFRL